MAPAVALLALAWVALLAAAPLLPTPAAALLYAAGSLICHQLPDRSFYLQGFQLPVCARCLGLYAGGAIGSMVALLLAPRTGAPSVDAGAGRGFTPRRKRATYAITAIAALPTAITFTLEWGAGWPFTNTTRAVAALPLGAIVAFVVTGMLATLHYGECLPRRPIGHGQPPATSI